MSIIYEEDGEYTIQTKNSGGGFHVVRKLTRVNPNKYAGVSTSIPGGSRRKAIREGLIANPVTQKEWKISEYFTPIIGSWFGMVRE